MTQIKRVAVVGAGTMGSQIALQTAYSGLYEVMLVDADKAQLDRATEQNRKLAARAVEKGRLSQEQADSALRRIEPSLSLGEAASSADLAIEAIYENLDAKLRVFEALGRAAPPNAIMASNSSTIAISRLAAASGRPERCCNTHFFHPVTVMQLCEVVRGPQTSDETIAAALEFVRSIDRVPVLVQREVHEGGYASAEDIDTAVKKGLNWPMGPFELLDFSGLDIFHGALEDRHRLGEGPPAPRVLAEKIEKGDLGRKTGRGFFEYPRS
jgi:3-hydroxybutyryl-CoA dehydrogenase